MARFQREAAFLDGVTLKPRIGGYAMDMEMLLPRGWRRGQFPIKAGFHR